MFRGGSLRDYGSPTAFVLSRVPPGRENRNSQPCERWDFGGLDVQQSARSQRTLLEWAGMRRSRRVLRRRRRLDHRSGIWCAALGCHTVTAVTCLTTASAV